MRTKQKYKSDAFKAIHSTVAGMYKAGTIDKETMRSFDDSCLTLPDSIEPAQIKLIRESQQVRQLPESLSRSPGCERSRS